MASFILNSSNKYNFQNMRLHLFKILLQKLNESTIPTDNNFIILFTSQKNDVKKMTMNNNKTCILTNDKIVLIINIET